MARFPKNYDRIMLIKPTAISGADKYLPARFGVSSRGSNFSEDSNTYYYFSEEGTGSTEPGNQSVAYTFTGHRDFDDPLQEIIFDKMLYDLSARAVEFIDFNKLNKTSSSTDEAPAWKAWHGNGKITISDDGSGDTTGRADISYTVNFDGKPEHGIVTLDKSTGAYTFTADIV